MNCSFCLKAEEHIDILFLGPKHECGKKMNICDQCIDLFITKAFDDYDKVPSCFKKIHETILKNN